MTLGTGILGNAILSYGSRTSGGPPVEPPVSNATVTSLLIQQTGVRIPNGDATKVIKFVLVDPADTKKYLTGLDTSQFSVSRVRESLPVTAVTAPTITELSQTLMPGAYSLLCDEDTTLPQGIDEQTITYRITHESITPQTLEAVIYRPKITVGSTLYAQVSTGATKLTNNSMSSLIQFMNALGINSNLVKVSGSADTLSRFAQAVDGNTLCVVGTGSTLTTIVTSSCDPVGVAGNPDQFAGKAGTFPKDTITPELRGKSFRITGSTGAVNPTLTVTGLTIAPTDGDKFNIL